MTPSRRRPARWLAGWRHTRRDSLPVIVHPRAATGPRAADDRSSSLARGVLVDTGLVARLLGLPILRVEGRVTLTPAESRVPVETVPVEIDTRPANLALRAEDADGGPVGSELDEVGRILSRLKNRGSPQGS